MTATTWDPSNTSSNITLSGGNLVATQKALANTFRSTRATNPKTSGKYYFEITGSSGASTLNGVFGGLSNSSLNLSSYSGSDTNSCGAQYEGPTTSPFYYNAASHDILTTGPANGHTMGFAIDIGNKLLWVQDVTTSAGWNTALSGTQNPGTGAGGQAINATVITGSGLYIAATLYDYNGTLAGDTATLNTGNSPFHGTIPSGFQAWDVPQSHNTMIMSPLTTIGVGVAAKGLVAIRKNPLITRRRTLLGRWD